MSVQAIYDAESIGLLVRWHDMSAEKAGTNGPSLPVPPEELPQKSPNTTYFLVDTTHPFWQMIKNGRNIAVFSDLPSDSTVIKLFPVATQD